MALDIPQPGQVILKTNLLMQTVCPVSKKSAGKTNSVNGSNMTPNFILSLVLFCDVFMKIVCLEGVIKNALQPEGHFFIKLNE